MRFSRIVAVAVLSWPLLTQAQYQGPSAMQVVTVKQMLATTPDDAYVKLQGHLLQKIDDDGFMFGDATGTVRVEIDPRLFPAGQPVNDKTMVEIEGEFDRNLLGVSEVEVSALRLVPAAAK